MRNVLISHNDLDGVGCGVVAREHFNGDIAIYFCDIKGIDERTIEILNENPDVKQLFITDITPKLQSTLDYIDTLDAKVILLDHHETSMKTYDNLVIPNNMLCQFDMSRCGTKQLSDYLGELEDFATIVDDYDRFQLKHKESIELNQLFGLYGEQEFFNRCNSLLAAYYRIELPTSVEESYLECIHMENDKYIQGKIKSIKPIEVMGKSIALIYGDRLVSMIAKKMREDKLKYDYVAMVMNGSTVSLRAIADDAHCGNFAKQLNKLGGGHAGAGGYQVNDKNSEEILKLIFSNQD